MESRLALAGLAVITIELWWFYARDLDTPWAELAIGATLAGGACGISTSRRRWWLPLLPLPVSAAGGIALSSAFSGAYAFGGDGDWSARAVVAFGGVWFGLIATAAAVVLLAVRAAAYSVEYFG